MELLDVVIMRSINVLYALPGGHAFSVAGQSKYVNGILTAATTFSEQHISNLPAQKQAACKTLLIKGTWRNETSWLNLAHLIIMTLLTP